MLEYPPLVVITAWFHAFAGDEDPVRWLRTAEAVPFEGLMPDGSSSYEGAVALLRAALCLDGPDRMRADLIAAAELDTPMTGWQVFYRLVAGEAALLLGETDRARTTFRNAAEAAGPLQAAGQAVALGELATIAADAGDWDEAHGWISQARSLVVVRGVEDILSQPLTFAVSARVFARRGEPDLARKELVEAQKLRPASSFAIPSFSIRGRVQMARAYLALADVEGARTVLREARDFQAHRPNIGRLAEELDEVEGEIGQARGSGVSGPATLSAAELRVLAMLPTHLSFRQIGERLFVSNNTVKSHAMSIYRKLGVSSRSQAVDRAAELGLIDL
jgi:LuxR family maltose regulon positive regulatory protein